MSKPDPNAKRKAHEYRQQLDNKDHDEQRKAERPRIGPGIDSEQEYHDLVGRRIEEAIRNGAFDNLRGKGKPLNLQRNPFVPEELEMAYSIMEANHITPEWIGDRDEVLRRIEAFRLKVREAVTAYQTRQAAAVDALARGQATQQWVEQIKQLETQLVALNRQIELVNFKQPTIHLEIFKLRLDDELTRAGYGAM
jgi:DnaJ homolog subfamily C member 28